MNMTALGWGRGGFLFFFFFFFRKFEEHAYLYIGG